MRCSEKCARRGSVLAFFIANFAGIAWIKRKGVEQFDTLLGICSMRGTVVAQIEREAGWFLYRQFRGWIDEFAEILELSGLTYCAHCSEKKLSLLAHFLQYLVARFKVVEIVMICNGWSKIRGGGMIACKQ